MMMSNTDERFLRYALRVAETSTHRYRLGAVVVKAGSVLSTATNKPRNNPKHCPHLQCSIHAEIAALRRAGMPRRARLYVARVHKNGNPALAKPCHRCYAVIKALQIKVFYT